LIVGLRDALPDGFMSGISYFINQFISERSTASEEFRLRRRRLTRLIWIASMLCITPRSHELAAHQRDLKVAG